MLPKAALIPAGLLLVCYCAARMISPNSNIPPKVTMLQVEKGREVECRMARSTKAFSFGLISPNVPSCSPPLSLEPSTPI